MRAFIVAWSTLQKAVFVVRETLREIFDEAAYARYLAVHGMANSRQAYRAFLADTEQARLRKPRCC